MTLTPEDLQALRAQAAALPRTKKTVTKKGLAVTAGEEPCPPDALSSGHDRDDDARTDPRDE